MKRLGKVIAYTAEMFKDTTDRGGNPYILHCLYVMEQVKHLGESAMICAVSHDTIEDSNDENVKNQLRQLGITDEEMLILELLTHRKETPYMDYIKALSVHPIAREIKKADLRHNSDITRLKGLRKKDFDRLEKYSIAYKYLED